VRKSVTGPRSSPVTATPDGVAPESSVQSVVPATVVVAVTVAVGWTTGFGVDSRASRRRRASLWRMCLRLTRVLVSLLTVRDVAVGGYTILRRVPQSLENVETKIHHDIAERYMTDVLLPLALLYADGRRAIRGATKLQKLAFLAQQEFDVDDLHEFQADKYGPFSPTLASSVKTLEDKGVIDKDVRKLPGGNEQHVYSLTDTGVELVRKLMSERDEDVESTLGPVQELKKERGDQSLDQLLRYVYKNYPEFTTESELDLAEEV
jgi:uncharacterized protein YwgA